MSYELNDLKHNLEIKGIDENIESKNKEKMKKKEFVDFVEEN